MSTPLLPTVTSSLAPNYPPTNPPPASGHASPETNNSQVQTLPDTAPYLHSQKQSPSCTPSITARQVRQDQEPSEIPAPIELWKAVKEKNIDQITTLIKTHKIDPNKVFDSPSTGSWTPLCFAAYHYYEDVVEVLVKNGADVDMCYKVNISPKFDADFSFLDTEKTWNALAFCAANRNVEACKLLLKHKPESLLNIMHSSLDSGRYCNEVISTLLKAEADPDGGVAPESDDCTPLACAASRARVAELVLLLEHGADPNRGSPKPICKAVQWGGGDNELTRPLIKKGAIFEPYYNYDEPPRHFPYHDHEQWQRDQKIFNELSSVQTELASITKTKFD